MDSRCDVLLLAAFPPELAALAPALGANLRGRVGALDVAASAVGVGLVASAVGAAAAVRDHAPRAVVLLGTCGVYPGGRTQLGRATVSREVRLVSPEALVGRAALPEPMPQGSPVDHDLVAALARHGADPVVVGTTLAVTLDDPIAARIGATGCDTEHLEAHAVASACAAWGVPFAALLGVANGVGSNGRDEWRRHHVAASSAAVSVALAWLDAGAEGLRSSTRSRSPAPA